QPVLFVSVAVIYVESMTARCMPRSLPDLFYLFFKKQIVMSVTKWRKHYICFRGNYSVINRCIFCNLESGAVVRLSSYSTFRLLLRRLQYEDNRTTAYKPKKTNQIWIKTPAVKAYNYTILLLCSRAQCTESTSELGSLRPTIS
ncbi:hypothetical protein L9F63_008570, partial [Diploptera punctata]